MLYVFIFIVTVYLAKKKNICELVKFSSKHIRDDILLSYESNIYFCNTHIRCNNYTLAYCNSCLVLKKIGIITPPYPVIS